MTELCLSISKHTLGKCFVKVLGVLGSKSKVLRLSCDTHKFRQHEHQGVWVSAEVKLDWALATSIRNIIPILLAVLKPCATIENELTYHIVWKCRYAYEFVAITLQDKLKPSCVDSGVSYEDAVVPPLGSFVCSDYNSALLGLKGIRPIHGPRKWANCENWDS